MTDTQALAYRRAGLVAAALLATAVAHGLTLADWHLTLGAPIAWGGWIAVGVLVGRRGRAWKERSFGRTTALLLALQLAAHACLTFAPWALGLAGHSEGASIGLIAIVAHCAAALTLACLIRFGERILTRATKVIDAIVRLLSRAAPGAAPRPAVICPPGWRPQDAAALSCLARGPPRVR